MLTQAGNYLDRVLLEYLLKKGGVEGDGAHIGAVRNRLSLRIRDYKETLFAERFVSVFFDEMEPSVEVEYDEFIRLPQVKQFVASIREAMDDLLKLADESWLEWVRDDPRRTLVVLLTGGCASLPMLQDLVGREITVNGRGVRTAPALPEPMWLDDLSLPGDVDYRRVAVALGGARRHLMDERVAKLTADRAGPERFPT